MGGRGWRHRFYATGAPGWAAGPGWGGANPPFVQPWAGPWSTEDELAYLKDYAANLQAALEDIRAQVADLESQQQGQPSSEKQG